MTLDEQTLVAYVDGQLSSEQAMEVEAALIADAQAREMVNQLRVASPDMIKAAFDVTLERPLSAGLEDGLVSGQIQAPGRGVLRLPYAIAASLVLLAAGVLGGYLLRGSGAEHQLVAGEDQWLMRVAQYQVLYGRETLALPDPPASAIREAEMRLGDRLGLELNIPDLSDHDVAFKRGQILSFEGNPLVQLAYLPGKGNPIAYCITTTNQPDSAPEAGVAEGLELFHWRRGGFAFVIIGETDRESLRAMAMSAFDAKTRT